MRRRYRRCCVGLHSLLLDHTTAATWRGLAPAALDAALNAPTTALLEDLLYVHTAVLDGRSSAAGAVGSTTLAQRTTPNEPVVLATLDCTLAQVGGAGAFLSLGLNNHLTGGYYWGRSSGRGAAMPAPGVALTGDDDRPLRLVRLENSNDGKRSEWCEFLRTGDQVQIVPSDPSMALEAFDTLVGVTRDGHRGIPRGAEPVVEAAWTREAHGEWRRVPWGAAFEVEDAARPKGAADFLDSWKV